ncbi:MULTISPECIES: hypothetical protein [unclassified Microcoleus]|uniref:hypothetical protein n=1 Tax=unclassified Microcoleus TaxID=2642155 RepID=UPI0025E34780|nr:MULTISPECIES: hypothetical protein [unclassified Microcoleus]
MGNGNLTQSLITYLKFLKYTEDWVNGIRTPNKHSRAGSGLKFYLLLLLSSLATITQALFYQSVTSRTLLVAELSLPNKKRGEPEARPTQNYAAAIY